MDGTVGERCDDTGVAGRRRRRQRSRGARQRAADVDVGQPAAGSAPDGEDAASGDSNGEHDEALWGASRSGAWAGRGFHFQHAVGAWLAAKVGAGFIEAVVVPEGFEDVSLEGVGGEAPWHVQAKSRGEDSGLFPVHEAVDDILDSWAKHLVRGESDSRLVVVFERGVRGEVLPTGLDASVPTLAESSPDGSKLVNSLKDKCGHDGLSEADTDLLLSSVVAVGVAWDQVTDETAASIGEVVVLPRLSLRVGADLLVGVVARASAENASRRHADRRRLDKTEIVGEIVRFAEQIDVESLEAAIGDGVCELFTCGVEELDEGGRFYEGEATQPFHVASGLVMRRPDVLEKILSSLRDRFAVVITGPSGVGKSAVLWTVPRELPGVVWFRVNRLTVENVPVILRLARANGVSTRTSLGFLVDSAGTGHFRGWERLRAEAAAVPGMVLVATARNEDLTVLGSLTECATIAVQLDQHSAEMIHRGLVLRGATGEAHWQEAFERSDGLTLEFTHLLTRGRRLRDVIEDQARQRVIEERHSELRVLALASTADRWSAAIATTDVARLCGLSDEELQGALYRLRAEHLVVETNGWIGGLHQLRSSAICEAVHAVPPPTLDETITRLIPVVPVSQLQRFVAALLIDTPEARSIISNTARELAADLERLAGCIQGLRLADAETVIDKHIAGATSEPWRLIGIGGHPTALDTLRSVLEDLYAVVNELANADADLTKIRNSARSGQSQTALNRAATTCRRADQRRYEKRRKQVEATCKAAEPRARVFDSAHRTALSEYRVCVELDSLFGWYEAVESLHTALRADQRARETYLLVPLRQGKPIPALAMTLINDLWPTPDPDGLDSLPPARPKELADMFDKAHIAL